jgi:hypothetical protein
MRGAAVLVGLIVAGCATGPVEHETTAARLQPFADEIVRTYGLPEVRVFTGVDALARVYSPIGVVYLNERIPEHWMREAAVAKGVALHMMRQTGPAGAWAAPGADRDANVKAVAILARLNWLTEREGFDRVRALLLDDLDAARTTPAPASYTESARARLRGTRVKDVCARLAAFDRQFPRYPRDVPAPCAAWVTRG